MTPFQVGFRVLLRTKDESGQVVQGESHIYGEEGDALILALPRLGDEELPIPAGTRVILRMEQGAKAFEAEVTVREVRQGSQALLLVDKPEDVTESARRRFFRVETDAPAWIGDQPARLLNLSGGGALIAVRKVLAQAGDRLEVRLGLPGFAEPLEVPCWVVRVQELADLGAFHVACTFDELPERDRDRLFRYLFTVQRQLLRKGLGRP